MKKKEKNAIVFSGGGSKGAFGGGIFEYLTKIKGKKYDIFVSTSTGTLLQLLGSTGNTDKLKGGYTTVTNGDIWKINPFKVITNKNGKTKVRLNYFNVIKNISPSLKFIKTKTFPWFKIKKFDGGISFGDSSNLLPLIKKFMSQKEYLYVKEELGVELVVCVVNATLKQVEYKSSVNWGYDDFCEWTQASCSAYPFMSPVVKNDFQYIDGGVLETVPIQEAINRGATNIDVVILKEESPKHEVEYMRNLVHGILTEIDMMHSELSKDDIQIGKLRGLTNEITLNFYYTPRRLTNNSLIFNKEIMTKWWQEGYDYAKGKNFKTYKMLKGCKPKLINKG